MTLTLNDLIVFIEKNRFNGRGASFGFDGNMLRMYIEWADLMNYLFFTIEDNNFTGVAIIYPLANKFSGDAEEFFDFKLRDNLPESDLCIMDFISTTDYSKKTLVEQAKDCYPNWKDQDKWSLRFGHPVKITNRYINLFNN